METLIETSRLFLRPIQLGDERLIFPAVDERLTQYWIGWQPSRTLQEERHRVERFLELARQTTSVYFLAFGKESQSFIGCCGIVPNVGFSEFEIDLWVKHEQQGKGYGAEMLNTLIAWARKNLKLPYLVYSVTEGNEASLAIIKKFNLPILRQFVAEKRGQQKLVTDYKLTLEHEN